MMRKWKERIRSLQPKSLENFYCYCESETVYPKMLNASRLRFISAYWMWNLSSRIYLPLQPSGISQTCPMLGLPRPCFSCPTAHSVDSKNVLSLYVTPSFRSQEQNLTQMPLHWWWATTIALVIVVLVKFLGI